MAEPPTGIQQNKAPIMGKLGRLKTALSAVSARALLSSSLAEYGRHEIEIHKGFSGQVRFEGATPVIDGTLVLIGFTNRSGSTLLAEYLRKAGVLGALGEDFNYDMVLGHSERLGCHSFPDYVATMHAQFRKRFEAKGFHDRQVGFKVSADQLRMVVRWNIPAMFSGGLKMINISRNDRIAQAVSFSIASQSKLWTSKQATDTEEQTPDPIYRSREIARYIKAVDRQNALMDLLISCYEIDVFDTSYENLTRQPTRVVRSAAAFLGQNDLQWSARKRPHLEKQATTVNKMFADRFRAEVLRRAGLKG